SVMETLFSEGVAAIGTVSAVSMLVFSLIYTPCVAAIASIRRELGHKWAILVVLWQCALAWVMALLFFWAGTLIASLV
ncbi:MAG: hypothetical protein J6X87_00795, partial [Clostridia bacterium]|nr:hypothetical protein [Clostridia bacterium]